MQEPVTPYRKGSPEERRLRRSIWKKSILAFRRSYPIHPSLDRLVRAVGNCYGLCPLQMRSQRRSRRLVYPRQVAIYLARKHCPKRSLLELAVAVGRSDHTTALYACEAVAQRMDQDPDYRAEVERVEAQCCQGINRQPESPEVEPYEVAEKVCA